ncbi:Hypothetical protein D9617_23g005640 [Elsinoe fawcettii]|nr:Hypothetical protein D9617_23g005640 [Elsinoe fawcettii]
MVTPDEVDDNRVTEAVALIIGNCRFPECCQRYCGLSDRSVDDLEREVWRAWSYASPFPLDKIPTRASSVCPHLDTIDASKEHAMLVDALKLNKDVELWGPSFGIEYVAVGEPEDSIW